MMTRPFRTMTATQVHAVGPQTIGHSGRGLTHLVRPSQVLRLRGRWTHASREVRTLELKLSALQNKIEVLSRVGYRRLRMSFCKTLGNAVAFTDSSTIPAIRRPDGCCRAATFTKRVSGSQQTRTAARPS